MVSVLKDHTTVIQDMRGEVSGLTKAVRGLIATADQNVEIIQELKRKVVENKSAIDEIQTSIDGFRKDFADIREKISVLPDYDERIKVGSILYVRMNCVTYLFFCYLIYDRRTTAGILRSLLVNFPGFKCI